MNTLKAICALATALTLFSAPALAVDPATSGALAVPANRVVGMWANEAHYGPCGGPAILTGLNTVTFEAGGTLVDNPRAPTGTSLQRSIGLGTWSYNPMTGQYHQLVRFDWFLDGTYDGYQTVVRTFLMSANGHQISGPIVTIRYNADGSIRAQLCGSAVSTRL